LTKRQTRGARGHRRLVLSGTATSTQPLRGVKLSITRKTKRGRRTVCEAITAKATVTRQRMSKAGCRAQFLLTARGTNRWRLTLPKGLPAGRWTIQSQATDTNGHTETQNTTDNKRNITIPKT
jgi:hypothetical protein